LQTDRANVDSSHLPLIASGEQHNRVLAVDDCWQAENQGQLEFGREDSCARLHQLSASVLAAFDLKELPDLSYGCPSTQQQDELATTLWTNLCQPNGAWVTLHSCDSGSHRDCQSSVRASCKRLSVAISIQNRPCGNTSGYQWLHRLVWAVVYVFGVKRGIGNETLSEFFHILHLEGRIGVCAGYERKSSSSELPR